MTDTAWRTWTARLGWLTAATFLAGSAVFLYLSFAVPPPEPPPDATFVDNLLAEFEDAQARRLPDFASSLLFTAGFAALAALGAMLRHVLGRDDPRTMLGTVAFLLAGAVGVASQLIYMGGTEVATNPEYCDCGFLAEEIISRGMIHFAINGIVRWMTDGFTVLFALGLFAVASAASASGTMPVAWVAFSRLLAIAGLAVVVWTHVAVPMLIQAGYEDLDYWLIGGLISAVIAGILVPVWAAWLARSLRPTEMPPAEPAT
jgi:hypothetical protein